MLVYNAAMRVRFVPVIALAAGFVAAQVALASCGAHNQRPTVADIPSEFYRPGFVTYVRYTTLIAVWPTHSSAWIDFDNQRSRSWNVTTTDAWDNPVVCTSVASPNDIYPCLPGLLHQLMMPQAASVPLRRGSTASAFSLRGDPREAEATQDGRSVTKYRWAALPIDEGQGIDYWNRCDKGITGQYFYEYWVDSERAPLLEVVGETCGDQESAFVEILYHEVRFVDPSALPPRFFNVGATQDELVSEAFSPVRQKYAEAYWLGLQAGEFQLTGMDTCSWAKPCVELTYEGLPSTVTPTAESASEHPMFTLDVGDVARHCTSGTPVESALAGGFLCAKPAAFAGQTDYSASWVTGDGLAVNLTADSSTLSQDELLGILKNLEPYDSTLPASKPPILTEDDVRSLVADALDVVCGSEWKTIRENRDTAHFTYDPTSGEWQGTFGPLGEYAVPDLKPVVIPVAARAQLVEGGGGYSPEYAECAKKETPTPP